MHNTGYNVYATDFSYSSIDVTSMDECILACAQNSDYSSCLMDNGVCSVSTWKPSDGNFGAESATPSYCNVPCVGATWQSTITSSASDGSPTISASDASSTLSASETASVASDATSTVSASDASSTISATEDLSSAVSATDEASSAVSQSADENTYCGGESALDVYVLESASKFVADKEWSYTGCYTDSISARTLPHGLGSQHCDIQTCLDLAAAAEYKYAVNIYGGECWGANQIASTGTVQSLSKCNWDCNDTRGVETCGGEAGLDVYQVPSAVAPTKRQRVRRWGW
ncbi:hypothetical protein JCM8547_003583 [Rhodosporidiobolus lusitaniae]